MFSAWHDDLTPHDPEAKEEPTALLDLPPSVPLARGIPHYLRQVYWWAYVHPRAVRLFERDWLVNLILFGNYARLRDAALGEMGATVTGRTLQVACVYAQPDAQALRAPRRRRAA